jgi:hypothetical protein
MSAVITIASFRSAHQLTMCGSPSVVGRSDAPDRPLTLDRTPRSAMVAPLQRRDDAHHIRAAAATGAAFDAQH